MRYHRHGREDRCSQVTVSCFVRRRTGRGFKIATRTQVELGLPTSSQHSQPSESWVQRLTLQRGSSRNLREGITMMPVARRINVVVRWRRNMGTSDVTGSIYVTAVKRQQLTFSHTDRELRQGQSGNMKICIIRMTWTINLVRQWWLLSRREMMETINASVIKWQWVVVQKSGCNDDAVQTWGNGMKSVSTKSKSSCLVVTGDTARCSQVATSHLLHGATWRNPTS